MRYNKKFEPLMAFDFIKRFDLLVHINEECLDSKGGFRVSLFQNKENQEFILTIAGSDLRPLKFDIRGFDQRFYTFKWKNS